MSGATTRTWLNGPTVLFSLGLALLFTHELDAALHAEWRLLWVLAEMSDGVASKWFIWLHLPVFLAALYLGANQNPKIRLTFRRMVCVFLPVHAALHFSLSNHPEYQFHYLSSDLMIYGAGACGITYVLLWWLDLSKHPA
ncbi:MAG: DUF6713 family protein [Pseudomonadales bacterium]|jgi:hypothetical protein|nr:DUF6713 family protein [Pseudomonadales bacterium]